jgi:hypothetical protein
MAASCDFIPSTGDMHMNVTAADTWAVSQIEQQFQGGEQTKPSVTETVTETVIIFDWDDTLLPSAWLTSTVGLDQTIQDLPAAQQQELTAHAGLVASLLEAASAYGSVVIITNAQTGWVQFSSERFMPSLLGLLDNFTIISARSTYEPKYTQTGDWKIHAFQDQVDRFYQDSRLLNIVSFGDGEFEREAALTAGRQVNQTGGAARTKSIKFIERPSVEHLSRQVELITAWLGYIVTIENDLDLMLTVSLLT